jgi:predicted HAD superfamily phosphohydrolase YqeG
MNLKKAMTSMNTTNKETAFVGDQLFTDVWAGNALSFMTILVKPIQDKEQMITKVKRGLESILLNRYLKKHGLEKY